MEEDGQKIGPKGAQKGLPTAFIDQNGVDHEFGIEIAESNFGAKSHGSDWEMDGENWNWGKLPSKKANKSERQTRPKRTVIWTEMSWSR